MLELLSSLILGKITARRPAEFDFNLIRPAGSAFPRPGGLSHSRAARNSFSQQVSVFSSAPAENSSQSRHRAGQMKAKIELSVGAFPFWRLSLRQAGCPAFPGSLFSVPRSDPPVHRRRIECKPPEPYNPPVRQHVLTISHGDSNAGSVCSGVILRYFSGRT